MRNMKRSGILLLVGGLITGFLSITAYAAAGGGSLTSQLLTIRQEGGFENQPSWSGFRGTRGPNPEKMRYEERIEPQLEAFDKACEESVKEYYLRLAQEKEPQLEEFDKACEESVKEFYLRLARERGRIDSEFTLVK